MKIAHILSALGILAHTMSEFLFLSFKPIKRNLWSDLEELFGSNGACGGCWCMNWKLRGKAYEEAKGYETRQMHKAIVDAGVVTGLLAYWHGEVAGWVAVSRAALTKSWRIRARLNLLMIKRFGPSRVFLWRKNFDIRASLSG